MIPLTEMKYKFEFLYSFTKFSDRIYKSSLYPYNYKNIKYETENNVRSKNVRYTRPGNLFAIDENSL